MFYSCSIKGIIVICQVGFFPLRESPRDRCRSHPSFSLFSLSVFTRDFNFFTSETVWNRRKQGLHRCAAHRSQATTFAETRLSLSAHRQRLQTLSRLSFTNGKWKWSSRRILSAPLKGSRAVSFTRFALLVLLLEVELVSS